MPEQIDFFNNRNYYEFFRKHSLKTEFVPLTAEEIELLAAGCEAYDMPTTILERLRHVIRNFSGRHFICVDYCSPTDSQRYLSTKRGAVISAHSIWNTLASSQKVRNAAAEKKVSCICLRKFRTFDIPREFRLFIHDGKLAAMSQRFLIRHFHRLQNRRETYWRIAGKFVSEYADRFPVKDMALDIYITTKKKVIVIDANPWGAPTDPLMLNRWDVDLSNPKGCLIVPPPQVITGDITVSF